MRRYLRGHGGPGRYLTRKRQLAGDKRDLEYLNKGGHLSVGFTKKRQAAYDARDKKKLEKRIKINEEKIKNKSDKKSKKMSIKKKIAIGAAVTAGVIAGAYAYKKIKDYKADNKKYSEYKKAVREIINNKKVFDNKTERDYHDIFSQPNPFYSQSKGEKIAKALSRKSRSESLNYALRDIESLNEKTFSDNRKDMRKEISNFMGETNRKKAVNNLNNIKNKASENVKLLRKRRK